MSRVYTDTLEPRKSTQDITLGTAGETISVGANSINVNTVKDKGGNTLWTSDGSGVLSSVNAGLKGNLVLLDTNTFTGASSSAFTTLIDSTYDVYIFKFNAMNPATASARFTFQVNAVGETGYNETITSTYFRAYHYEGDTGAGLDYVTARDQAQGTAYQDLNVDLGNEADECFAGELHVFTPSNTTYVKHFYAQFNNYCTDDSSRNTYAAGYINTTSAIDAIDFKMAAGNMDGEIKMYGLL